MTAERLETARDDLWSTVLSLLPALWLPLCAFFALALLYAVIGRLAYPYPLEWLEPDTPDIAARILAGLPVYGAPSYAYVPSMKTPLYYYVVAAFSSLFGDGLLAGRLVSLLATVGVALFVWLFVRREGGTRVWAAFGVGLFLATYHIARDWYDIARLDSFFLLLTMGAAYSLRFAPRMRGAILAGLLFAAAFFTKQAVLMLMIPALLFYAFAARRRVLAASLVAATVIVLGMLALHVATGGWSSFFLIEVPRHVVIESDAAVTQFWISDMLAPLGVALTVSIAWIASLWRTDRGAALFYTGLLGGALLIGWAGRANVAGSTNVLMPAYAAFAITMPLGLARALRACSSGGGVKRAGCVGVNLLALLQLGLLFYDPRQAIPSAADRALSDAILARLRAVDGAILTTDDRFFAKRLSNGSVGLDYSLIDLVNDRGSAVSAQFQDSIIDALRAGRFVGVVDPPDFLRDKVSFGAPLVLQSTPPERRNRFTPRMQLYYPVAR
jgi:4-amino-4-deoxy-L-arabinose transferase-like glycosyltransferase